MSDIPSNRQARVTLVAKDEDGTPVTLDDNAYSISQAGDPSITFDYNPIGNGLVVRGPDDSTSMPNAVLTIVVDGQPGPGQSFLPIDLAFQGIPAGAVALDSSVTLETKGTPA